MKIWDIHRTVYKVSDFYSWQKDKSLVLSPKYQRRSVWPPLKKSFLIDTIIKNLPIPIIFIRERNTDLDSFSIKREVVDGQQRLRTILGFIRPDIIKDYDKTKDHFTISRAHNKSLAGKTYATLEDDIKKRILDYQLSVHILPNDVDDKELIIIFSRLNSTGMQLNKQELRNASYFGEFKTSIYQEAPSQLTRWKKWKIFNEQQIARMGEAEFSSELYILIMDGISGSSASSIDSAYKKFEETFDHREEVEFRFNAVFDVIDDYMGEDIGGSVYSKKTMFYALFSVIYELIFGFDASLDEHMLPKRINQDDVRRILRKGQSLHDKTATKEALDASTRRTTHKSSRTFLFNYLLDRPLDEPSKKSK